MTDTTLHVLYTLVRWRFFMMPVFIMVPLVGLWCSRGVFRLIWSIALPISIVLGIANFTAGTGVRADLIHRYGAQAQAIVTGTFDTGNQYNDRRVMGHNVLIKTTDGRTIETSFEDDDFNVYPSQNAVYYPQDGDIFNVRYLEGFPTDFIIIISNDESPWAHGLRCSDLVSAVREADTKQQFAPTSPAYRKSYEDAVHAAETAGCGTVEDN